MTKAVKVGESIHDCIAYQKKDESTYRVGYVEKGVFSVVVEKRCLYDALQMCGLMQIANPQYQIKQLA